MNYLSLKTLGKRFKSDESGNVSLMFAASFVAMFIGIGAAIDLSLVSKSKSQLQGMTDAATMAATRFDGTNAEKEKVFKDYLAASVKLGDYSAEILSSSIEIEFDGEKIVSKARVDASHKLLMMQV